MRHKIARDSVVGIVKQNLHILKIGSDEFNLLFYLSLTSNLANPKAAVGALQHFYFLRQFSELKIL